MQSALFFILQTVICGWIELQDDKIGLIISLNLPLQNIKHTSNPDNFLIIKDIRVLIEFCSSDFVDTIQRQGL